MTQYWKKELSDTRKELAKAKKELEKYKGNEEKVVVENKKPTKRVEKAHTLDDLWNNYNNY